MLGTKNRLKVDTLRDYIRYLPMDVVQFITPLKGELSVEQEVQLLLKLMANPRETRDYSDLNEQKRKAWEKVFTYLWSDDSFEHDVIKTELKQLTFLIDQFKSEVAPSASSSSAVINETQLSLEAAIILYRNKISSVQSQELNPYTPRRHLNEVMDFLKKSKMLKSHWQLFMAQKSYASLAHIIEHSESNKLPTKEMVEVLLKPEMKDVSFSHYKDLVAALTPFIDKSGLLKQIFNKKNVNNMIAAILYLHDAKVPLNIPSASNLLERLLALPFVNLPLLDTIISLHKLFGKALSNEHIEKANQHTAGLKAINSVCEALVKAMGKGSLRPETKANIMSRTFDWITGTQFDKKTLGYLSTIISSLDAPILEKHFETLKNYQEPILGEEGVHLSFKDLAQALQILKTKNVPITEGLFNELIQSGTPVAIAETKSAPSNSGFGFFVQYLPTFMQGSVVQSSDEDLADLRTRGRELRNMIAQAPDDVDNARPAAAPESARYQGPEPS